MNFAFEVIKTIKSEQPELFDDELRTNVHNMMDEAIECEMQFAEDALQFGITGMSRKDMRSYLEFCADQRLVALGFTPIYKSENPFGFMELQDVQELTNFFERRVSAYQVGIEEL